MNLIEWSNSIDKNKRIFSIYNPDELQHNDKQSKNKTLQRWWNLNKNAYMFLMGHLHKFSYMTTQTCL